MPESIHIPGNQKRVTIRDDDSDELEISKNGSARVTDLAIRDRLETISVYLRDIRGQLETITGTVIREDD